jgi:hypothetical protein
MSKVSPGPRAMQCSVAMCCAVLRYAVGSACLDSSGSTGGIFPTAVTHVLHQVSSPLTTQVFGQTSSPASSSNTMLPESLTDHSAPKPCNRQNPTVGCGLDMCTGGHSNPSSQYTHLRLPRLSTMRCTVSGPSSAAVSAVVSMPAGPHIGHV